MSLLMDALKKAEQAKQNAGSQPVVSRGAPAVLDENVLQPPPELLAEAAQEAERLAVEQAEEPTSTPQYAYEWVELLDEQGTQPLTLVEAEKNADSVSDDIFAENALVLENEDIKIQGLEQDKTFELHLELVDDVEPAKANAELSAFEVVAPAIVDKTPAATSPVLPSTPPTNIQWLDAEDESHAEPSLTPLVDKKPMPQAAPIDWLDDREDEKSKARLAAEQLLRAESRGKFKLQKKPSNTPILLGFLLVVLLVLGGAYYALNLVLESMTSNSMLTAQGEKDGEDLKARIAAAGCPPEGGFNCMKEYEARQKAVEAENVVANNTKTDSEQASSTIARQTTSETSNPRHEAAQVTPVAIVSPNTSVAQTTQPSPTTQPTTLNHAADKPPSKPKLTINSQPAPATPIAEKVPSKPGKAVQGESSSDLDESVQLPEGKFYDGMKKYELQQLARQGFFIRRETAPPSLQSQLNAAYAAYQNREADKASLLYKGVLQQQPRNRDALLGLAALAQQQGQIEQARDRYNRVLQLHPGDTLATAGLLSLAQQAPSFEQEQQLLVQIDKQPNAHWLHFALGSLYGRQERWREAEQAYFEAYRHNTENPDYLYNLAVSLEHLQKNRTALGFYEEALKSVERGVAAHFEVASVQQRIAQLKAED